MKARHAIGAAAIAAAVMAFPFAAGAIAHVKEADLVYENADVVTLDPAHPHASWISVGDGRILGVGTSAFPTFAGPATTHVDLHGATVLPGFVDSHIHLDGLGDALDSLDLSSMPDEAALVKAVAARAKTATKGAWIRGEGWNQNDWPGQQFPTRPALDAVTPDHPVILDRIDGHAVFVNAVALKLAGVTAKTADPKGGRILRDANGEPTGVFVDAAIDLVARVVPKPSQAEIEADLLRGQAWCHAHGMTGIHDAAVSRAAMAAYRHLDREGKLTLRVYAIASAADPALLAQTLKKGPQVGEHLTVRAIKMFADGALGSRGAALLADYSDDPGNRGLAQMSEKEIERIAEKAMRRGIQPCTHAIGDRANREVLDAYEAALKATKRKDVRPRIEHAQVVALDDLPRFAKLGVIASMQPWHVVGDKPWAEARVGHERIRGAYAWRTILDSGAHLTGGSDAPAGGISAPLQGIHCAATREDDGGGPTGGWYPEQKMTRLEAVQAFTTWPAYASFQETWNGTLTGGNRADFVVLSQNPITVPPEQILATRVLRTVVGGKEVYVAPAAAQADADAKAKAKAKAK